MQLGMGNATKRTHRLGIAISDQSFWKVVEERFKKVTLKGRQLCSAGRHFNEESEQHRTQRPLRVIAVISRDG